MKKIVAFIPVFLSFPVMYDIFMILIGTYQPPYIILHIGEVNTSAYLFYKITSVIVLLIIGYQIFTHKKEVNKQSTQFKV